MCVAFFQVSSQDFWVSRQVFEFWVKILNFESRFWVSSQNFLSFEPSFWVSSQVFEFRAKFSSVSLIFKFWGRIPSQGNLFRVKILKFRVKFSLFSSQNIKILSQRVLFRVKILKFRVVFTFSSQNFKIPRQNFKESSFHFFKSKL